MINKLLDLLPENIRVTLDLYKVLKNDYRFFNSFHKFSLIETPWLTYPAIEFLSALELKNKKVLEWGSGGSTLYWANRGCSVTSIETDPEWYQKVSRSLQGRAQLILENKSNLATRAAKLNKKYDLILIDSWERLKCAKSALNLLKRTGFIILDNSDWYLDAKTFLLNNHLIEIPFSGFGPGNGYTWTTSIFISKYSQLEYTPGYRPKGSLIKYVNN